ncbi:MAG: RsmB/NOP family class I SAM-dependent RNA methyltransferase [Burkholderiaceae bacterium]|nr:MAG: RsmB/NOP family class I SAM-dependent RNA methyltransferase [Burkholderiaceae bacterium]
MKAVEECLQFKGPADGTLSYFFRNQPKLGQRERGLVAETVYAVLRFKSRYMHLAESGSGNQLRRWVLLALSELQAMPVDPNALKELCSPTEYEWLRSLESVDVTTLPLTLQTNLPPWLLDLLVAQYGQEQTLALAAALNQPAPLDVRVNTVKSSLEQVTQALDFAGIAYQVIPGVPDVLRLNGKPALHRVNAFTDGWFEVQDVGSQLLAHLVAPKRGEMVVDFCAGAGGKTLALGALMRNTGRLYAFDVSEGRLSKLKPRLARSGLSNVHPVRIDHENDAKIKRLAGKIDRVLVDAPCSGLGTLRRNPDLKWRQTPESVRELVAKQGSILASASRLVKTGGRLVYATCSLLQQENQDIVAAFLAAHPQWQLLPAREALHAQKIEIPAADDSPYLQLLPHQHDSDGFFAAVLVHKA